MLADNAPIQRNAKEYALQVRQRELTPRLSGSVQLTYETSAASGRWSMAWCETGTLSEVRSLPGAPDA